MKLFSFSVLFFIFQLLLSQNSSIEYTDSIFFEYKRQLTQAKLDGNIFQVAKKQVHLGDYYQSVEINTQAIERYNDALSVLKDQFSEFQVIIKNKIGLSYIELKNYAKSREYLNESILISEKNNFTEQLAFAESLLGTTFEKETDYLRALKHQNKSLQLYLDLKNEIGIGTVYENIGSVYEDIEQYNKALNFFIKSNKLFSDLESSARVNVVNNIADIYRKTGRLKEALHFTNKALQLAEFYKDNHQIESAHKDLSKVYVLLGDYKKAFSHLSIYKKLQEAGFYSQNFKQLNALQTIYDTQEKESEIALLKQQNKVSEANQNLLIIGGTLLILVIGGVFYFYNKKRKETARVQVYEQKLLEVELEKKSIEEKKLQDEIHLKTASLSKYSLNMAQKNKMIAEASSTLQNLALRSSMDPIPKIKSLAKELNKSLADEEEWDEFLSFFQEIHPQFIKNLSEISNSKLSSTELRLAMLLRLNLSSKEIAAILRVTPDSVRVARYRLRKKLPIEQKQELVNFMLQF
ncbi:tetratricopeptide repeat protein [Zunongwangia sp.]|uniref:tetratricopeptide repeat protein n=1 Tax=Zunongwangia sp. TaxID=1965325 RepID=UPI003AA7F532